MSEILEIIMVVCFGASWPLNLYKSIKARNTKGSSLHFYCLIAAGYVAGIFAKFLSASYMASFAEKWYVLIFYFINLIMVGLNILVFFRNKRIEKAEQKAENA